LIFFTHNSYFLIGWQVVQNEFFCWDAKAFQAAGLSSCLPPGGKQYNSYWMDRKIAVSSEQRGWRLFCVPAARGGE